jgi:hypothetical protein
MNLAGLARGLAELGLVDDGDVPPPAGEDALPTWLWMSERAGGGRLVFPADGFYSADWDESRYPELKRAVLARLEAGGPIWCWPSGPWPAG